MTRKSSIVVGGVCGLTVAFLTATVSGALPRETLARRFIEVIHWPEYVFLEWLVDRVSPHNRDQGILYWLIVHPLYWVSIGMLAGLGYFSLARLRKRRVET